MFHIVYVSSAVKLFTPDELRALLLKSRDNNAKLDITGLLLYKDGNFIQALEGEEGAVRKLYAKIAADPRHHGLLTLLQGVVPERQFPSWSMGFQDLNSEEARATPGFSEFLNVPLTGQEFSPNPSRAHKLLLVFKKNM